MTGALFERTVLLPPKVSPLVTALHPAAESILKDTYLLDFLDLPATHSEADLQSALVANLKMFLLELGRASLLLASSIFSRLEEKTFVSTCFSITASCNVWWLSTSKPTSFSRNI